jgi:hypothetical protein
MRGALLMLVVVACSRTPQPSSEPTVGSGRAAETVGPAVAAPVDARAEDASPPDAAAAVATPPADARRCPRQCMDICCEADEACAHGPTNDGHAKCIRVRRPPP